MDLLAVSLKSRQLYMCTNPRPSPTPVYVRGPNVVPCDLLQDDAAVQFLLQLPKQDPADGDVAGQGVRAAKVPGQGHQQMQSGHHILGVDACKKATENLGAGASKIYSSTYK